MNHVRSHHAWLTVALAVLLAAAAATAADGPRAAYLTYPDIHQDRLVFCAESDLWTADARGQDVRRLTTHPGNEYFPMFAPDGASIAFTGEYDGNRDVYVVPAGGGEPRRLTWHPAPDEVVGWWPDGQRVIFRSGGQDPHGNWHLYTVALAGGDPEELPLGWATRLDVDPATGLWAFNRSERERATWKRYRGGTASDIWVGDPEKADFRQVTDFPGPDLFPMWNDGRIYFLSDQGGTANLWSIAADGSDRRRHTDLDGGWDARWPAMGPDGRIVFTVAADLHVFDPATGEVARIDVTVPSDHVLTRVRYPDVGRWLTEATLSPDGERVAIVARGEVYSVAAKDGVTLPLSRTSGARERGIVYGPDGKKLLCVTDATGEEAFAVMDAWGRGEPETVKKAREGLWHYPPKWSPDGEWIAWGDSDYRLMVQKADGGGEREVDRGDFVEISDYAWSPDGRWLAYVKLEKNQFPSVYIYDTQAKATHAVTDANTADHSPAWDPDGRYLYFVSARATNPILGQTDWNNVETRNEMLYMVLLREDVENPLANRNGLPPAEEDAAKDGDDDAKKDGNQDEAKKEDGDEEKPEPVEIDLDGLQDRVVELPVERGNYGGLAATASHLFYVQAPLKGMAEQAGLFQSDGPDRVLMAFSLDDREAKPFVEGISGYELSGDGSKVLVMQGPGQLFVVGAAAPPGGELAKGKVDLSDVVIELEPRAEWAQIYHEAWRQLREFYWDEDMAGLDWQAIGERYASLLPRLASRADLSDLVGQLFGEVNTSHSYVWGGDPGVKVDRVGTGLLGCDTERDGDAYRVTRIYRGAPADRVRSPLDEPGVGVGEGDYIVAVNRTPVADAPSLLALLQDRAGKEVLLTVAPGDDRDATREVLVKTLPSEHDLRYADWVRRNREYVAEKTGGKIGYVHVPNMWTEGLVAFNKWFYPQLDKEGMIVDVRWNGGGAVSQMLVERLRRSLLAYSLRRGSESLGTYPERVLNGPFVVLTNEFAGSDGDIFPQAIQIEKLAPVIGKRSWGGVVGISSVRPLVDGGMVTNPQVAWWDFKDGFGLENRGVIPDIEVQNLPQELARGEDAQLDRGIKEVMRLHAENPPKEPDFEKIRQRTRKAFRDELK